MRDGRHPSNRHENPRFSGTAHLTPHRKLTRAIERRRRRIEDDFRIVILVTQTLWLDPQSCDMGAN